MTGRETRLDRLHRAMEADESLRPRFYEALADAELTLWLAAELQDGRAEPKVVALGGQDYVLAFDLEERLAEIAPGPVPVLGLPGRALAAMLAGQGTGIALNMGDAPSAALIPPEAVDWLNRHLSGLGGADMARQRPRGFGPADSLPAGLAEALEAKLQGLAAAAVLAAADYGDGSRTPVLALAGVAQDLHPIIAATVNEAVGFTGAEGFRLDVVFLDPDAPEWAEIAAIGASLDLTPDPGPQVVAPGAPGMDPGRPPKLR